MSYESHNGSGGYNSQGGASQPPEVDPIALILKNLRPIILGAVALLLLIGMRGSYYQVGANEVGIVLRFGKHLTPNAEPGPHFKIPFGVDRVFFVPVQAEHKMEFGFRTLSAGIKSKFGRNKGTVAEAKMLTADLNVATIEWIVQYKINNPVKYLFRFRDVDNTLRLMTEAMMRAVVGDYSLDELLTQGRAEVEREALLKLQQLNERYDTGIIITLLKLQTTDVPEVVKPALREVEQAKQERARLINQADTEYLKIIPRAKGRAQQSLAEAEGYREQRVNRAKGDAARFSAQYEAYKTNKVVTRTRLYIETMERVLPKVKEKIIIDERAKGVFPLLHLGGQNSVLAGSR